MLSRYGDKQREFLDFALSQYAAVGESELDTDKLPDLLELKYGSPGDALRELGSVQNVRSNFSGFQQGLYESDDGRLRPKAGPLSRAFSEPQSSPG
jgi:type I restriction enzyme, R subunit